MERRRKACWDKHKSPLHAKRLRITAKPTALPNRACPSQIDITKEGSLKNKHTPAKKPQKRLPGVCRRKQCKKCGNKIKK